MPSTAPSIVSLGDLVRMVRENKAQAPHDLAVDAAIRKRVADTGNAFWMDVADRILQEMSTTVDRSPPAPTPPTVVSNNPPDSTGALPVNKPSSFSTTMSAIGDWIGKYLGNKLAVAILSAATAISAWRAASGPPADSQNVTVTKGEKDGGQKGAPTDNSK